MRITVNGEVHEVDLRAELEITAPEVERSRVAAQVGYWGVVAATAEGHVDRLVAERDHFVGRGLVGALQRDEKLAEWKAKAVVEAMPALLELDQKIAAAREAAGQARAVASAFTRKCDLLRALIAREVGEARAAQDIGRDPDSRLAGYREERRGKQHGGG